MSHHSGDQDPKMKELFDKAFGVDDSLGPTGRHPAGKLTDSDAGETMMRIATIGERIIVDFAKPMAWLGLTVVEARGLADLLNKHADSISPRMTREQAQAELNRLMLGK